MDINTELLEKIPQTNYLVSEKHRPYRTIMRIFYQEYQKMHYKMDKETIFSHLREFSEFFDYTIDQLKSDLNQLVEWKNLTPIQDPHKVYTVADYKNKQFQYSMSEVAVEVERMTLAVENLLFKTSTLSVNLFRRIYHSLLETDKLSEYSSKGINEWWQNLQEDFKRLNQSYQDYYRDFYSPESQKSMRSAAFIIHKKQFISYLQDFIQELQSCVVQMETLLNALTADKIDIALEQVVSSELEIPRPQSEQHELLEEKLRGNIKGKWQAIANWFSGEKSTAKEVLEVTNEVIRHIVQNAALLVQMQNVGVSKKAEYIKFLALFHNCKTTQEAHCLSAYVFGVQQVRHFIINDARSADSITSSIYEEKPMEFPIRPRVRTYKPRIDRSGFQDKSAEKVEAQKRVIQEQQRLREEVFKHIKKGKLDFSDLEELISPEVRSIFLGWIAGANMDAEKRGTTEYGQVFSLKRDGNKSCCMRCTDGELMMPAYVLVFEGDSYA